MDPADSLTADLLLHGDFVRNLADSLLGQDGADAAQDTFVRALQRPPRGRGSLRGWLGTVLGNVARNRRRAASRRGRHELAAGRLAADGASSVPSVDEVVAREETRARVVAAVLRLPGNLRDVLLLRFYEGFDSAAIGRTLGLAASTVRARQQAALERLRDELDGQHGGRRAWATALAPWAAARPLVPVGALFRATIVWRAMAALAAVWLLWVAIPDAPLPVDPAPGGVRQPIAQQVDVEPRQQPGDAEVRRTEVTSVEPPLPDEHNPNGLFGRVVAAAGGAPVPGAEVVLEYRRADEYRILDPDTAWRIEVLGSVVSDGEGRFRFDVRRGRPHRLTVRAAGYPVHRVPLVFGGSEVVVPLGRGAFVRGVVRDARSGAPLDGIEVQVEEDGRRTELATRSAADGRFALDQLPPGNCQLCASGHEFQIVHRTVTLHAGQVAEVELALQPAREVTGRVTDAATGQAIAGAMVTSSWLFRDVVTTDGDGRFALGQIGERAHLHVRAAGYASDVQQVPSQDPHPVLQFALRAGGSVVGRVLGADGNGLAAAMVAAARDVPFAAGGVHTDWCPARVEPDGRFVIECMANANDYQIGVRAPGHGARTLRLPAVPPGGRLDLGNLTLAAEALLEGHALDVRGEPLAAADVYLTGGFGPDVLTWGELRGNTVIGEQHFPFAQRHSRTAGDGAFRFAGLAPGNYTLSVVPRGVPWSIDQRVEQLQANEARTGLRLQATQGLCIAGMVQIAGLRALPEDARIRLVARHEDGELGHAAVARDGTFRFDNVREGRHRVTAAATPAGFALVPMIDVTAGTEGLSVVLVPAETVRGRVIEGDNHPVRGAAVHFWGSHGDVSVPVTTSDDGTFCLEVPPGAIGGVQVTDPDDLLHQVRVGDVRAGAAGVVVRLR